MGKKIFLSICGGIAICGLILAIVGLALGGRPGSITVAGGQLVYANRDEVVPLIDTPGWIVHWSEDENLSANTPLLSSPTLAAPFTEGELREVDIQLSAGYLVVQSGDTFGLSVDGPMAYQSHYKNGVWHLSARTDGLSRRHNDEQDRDHFWHDGRDLTTTFTLTLPSSFSTLKLSIGMGEAKVSGLVLGELHCQNGMGSTTLQDVQAEEVSLSLSAGDLVAKQMQADTVSMDCAMGNIEWEGEIRQQLVASCAMGRIKATVPRPSQYGYSIDVGFGSISIDGNHRGAGFASTSEGDPQSTQPFYDLSCSFGSIEVLYR